MRNSQTLVFKSGLLHGGNPFSRNIIFIDGAMITLSKKGIFSKPGKTVSIPLGNIVDVKIRKSFSGASIHIESLSHRSFTGHGFSEKMAMEICKTLGKVRK